MTAKDRPDVPGVYFFVGKIKGKDTKLWFLAANGPCTCIDTTLPCPCWAAKHLLDCVFAFGTDMKFYFTELEGKWYGPQKQEKI